MRKYQKGRVLLSTLPLNAKTQLRRNLFTKLCFPSSTQIVKKKKVLFSTLFLNCRGETKFRRKFFAKLSSLSSTQAVKKKKVLFSTLF